MFPKLKPKGDFHFWIWWSLTQTELVAENSYKAREKKNERTQESNEVRWCLGGQGSGEEKSAVKFCMQFPLQSCVKSLQRHPIPRNPAKRIWQQV